MLYDKTIFSLFPDSIQFLQRLGLSNQLKVHQGCVNSVVWSDDGNLLLSGSDDQHIVISNPFTGKIIHKHKTSHRANIFSSRFLPHSNNENVVSCSGDGIVMYTDLSIPQNDSEFNDANTNYFNCHNTGTTYELLTVPTEPKTFMSCGEDGTVRLYDLRKQIRCHKTCCKDNILIMSPSSVTSMSLAPISNFYIAVGSSDSHVRIYDRRFLSVIDFDGPASLNERHTVPVKSYTNPTNEKRTFRVTSLTYSPDESEILVNYSSDHLYLFDLTKDGIEIKFDAPPSVMDKGKRNAKTQNNVDSPPPVRRLRLRGDWSDTGPSARPANEMAQRTGAGQARPQLQATIMQRMTEVLSRMLADPRTRVGLSNTNEITNDSDLANVVDNFRNFAAESNNDTPGTSGSRPATKKSEKTVNDSEDEDDDSDEDDGKQTKTKNDSFDDLKALEVLEAVKEKLFDYVRMKFVGHRNAR